MFESCLPSFNVFFYNTFILQTFQTLFPPTSSYRAYPHGDTVSRTFGVRSGIGTYPYFRVSFGVYFRVSE